MVPPPYSAMTVVPWAYAIGLANAADAPVSVQVHTSNCRNRFMRTSVIQPDRARRSNPGAALTIGSGDGRRLERRVGGAGQKYRVDRLRVRTRQPHRLSVKSRDCAH